MPLHHLSTAAPTTVPSPFMYVSKVRGQVVHALTETAFQLRSLIDEDLPWRHCMVELSTLCETMKPSFWMLVSAPQHLFSSFYLHKLWRVFAPRSLSCSYQQLNLPFCACLPGTIGSIDSGNNVQVSFYVVQQAPSCLCVYIS